MKDWWGLIADAVESGRLVIVTSPAAIEEFEDVVRRPSFVGLIDAADAAAIADLLRRADLCVPTTIVPVCRDPNDDYLLALASESLAHVLVTRDEDLLVLGRHGSTEIVHVAEFLKRL